MDKKLDKTKASLHSTGEEFRDMGVRKPADGFSHDGRT